MTKVTDASEMFYACFSLKTTPDMTGMTSLKNVESMYSNCTSLTTAKIGSLDFSSSDLNHDSMFEETPELKTVISNCADEDHLSWLKSHLKYTHSSKVVTQGETSDDGVTVFTIN